MAVPSQSNYPSALDTDAYFGGDVVDQTQLTLTADISDSSLVMTVDEDIDAIEVPVYLVFATGEIVFAEGKDDLLKQFSSLTRGVGVTNAAPHTAGEAVRVTLVSVHLNAIKWAIEAIEAELGLTPSGSFATVKARLDGHNHTGGDNGPAIATSNLSGHTKAAHDALLIDADTVDGSHAAAFATAGHTHALGDLSNVSATGEGTGGGFDADTVDGYEGTDLRNKVRAADGGALVLSSGVLTVLGDSFYTIAPEGALAYDDMVSISGGADGDVLFLCLDDMGDTITLKNGTGNLYTPHATDYLMSVKNPMVMLRNDGGNWRVVNWTAPLAAIEVSLGNGVDTIAAGARVTIEVPFNCKIVQWSLVGDVVGACKVDIWERDYGAMPNDSFSMCNGQEPQFSGAQMARSGSLGSWTWVDLTEGKLLTFNVDSATTVTSVLCSLKVLKK